MQAAILLTTTLALAAPGESPRVVLATLCEVPPVLDGALDDPCWQPSEAESGFTRLLTEGPPPTWGTRFRAVYDQTALYVGVECDRDPSHDPITRQAERDSAVFEDDCVELFLDPRFDRTTYYHFAFNSRGVQYDADGYNRGWDGAWRVACRVAADTWTAEVAIPFDTVKATPESGHLWGLNVCRNTWLGQERELTAWSDPGPTFHAPHRFGQLVFGRLLDGMRRFAAGQAAKLKEQVNLSQPLLDQASEMGCGTSGVQDFLLRADDLRASLDSRPSFSRTDWGRWWRELEGMEQCLDHDLWDLKMNILAALAQHPAAGRERRGR
jgi:hypothetical protein